MAEFEFGCDVSFMISDRHPYDGSEVTGKLLDDVNSQKVRVEVPGDLTYHFVLRSDLLRAKGPYFDVRGLVLTTSASHPDEVGEIIATGKTPSEKLFFKVRFQRDGAQEWFSEDQVYVEKVSRRIIVNL